MTDPGYGRYLFSASQNYLDRQMQEKELELQKDKWATEKRGIDYDFKKKSLKDKAIGEAWKNLQQDILDQQTFEKNREELAGVKNRL